MNQELYPYDHKSLFMTGGTIAFAAITQVTANEIATFFTIITGITATIYNVIKTIDYLKKRKDNE